MIRIIAQRHNVPFLCDASQAVGKIPIQFNPWGITLLALSAHKLYGPQGVGALVVRRGHRLAPLLHGGGQQQGLRPGTLNLPGIVGLGEACRTSGTEAPSHVLRAMGLPSPILDSALRLSLGKFCSDNDLHPTATLLHQAVQAIHSLTTGVP